MTAILRVDAGPDESVRTGKNLSIWLMMTRSPEDLLMLSADKGWVKASTGAKGSVWTDDFSNIWTAFKKR